jgi:hypothetical protein
MPVRRNTGNNVMSGSDGPCGWTLPSATKNVAGWKFINCSGTIPLIGGAAANPYGAMKFADLPGQFSDPTGLYQPGPIESQEYSIIDRPTVSSGNFAVSVTTGGGVNDVKLRRDNTGRGV